MAQARLKRIAEKIKREIGEIIHDELKDPRIGFVTITKVDLSRDLRFAKIYFSLFGTEKQLRDTQIGLARSRGYIRKLLGQRMKLRYTPEIVFRLDESVEYSMHISEILEKIKKESKTDERTKGSEGNKKIF